MFKKKCSEVKDIREILLDSYGRRPLSPPVMLLLLEKLQSVLMGLSVFFASMTLYSLLCLAAPAPVPDKVVQISQLSAAPGYYAGEVVYRAKPQF